ncbi:MAG: hypothetical protein GY841_17915 [FCB group bacterium]|nr:hypothetical protein [FCB group bacterium]
MRAHKNRPETRLLSALVLVLSLLTTSAAFGQGSIFGAVANSDVSVPANGEISFFGYLDDTDEEIRIESSIGAGYDAGNWYDDFQNYLTEAPGNPYDYHFYNTANVEGYILSDLIPNNSFQQEDITLGAVAWPTATTGLTGKPISSSAVIISWNGSSGMSYHVYRRLANSDGSFFRIDDPSGSLSNPGTADSFFVDTGVDGISDYHYLVIPEDGSGNLGPHSVILTVSSGAVETPVVMTITPTTGFTIGGTAVTITGSGFDPAGADATIGGVALVSPVIVSPFEIIGLTPAGTAGAVDVVVTNTASALAAAPLVGGFTYVANNAPVLSDIPDQTIAEGAAFVTINLDDYVTDSDNTDDEIVWTYTGNTALTVDITARVATITMPDADWNGAETITFRATDPGTLYAEDAATFTVTPVNDVPIVIDIPDQTVAEGASFTTINLDDYVSDADNTDDEMIWSYTGNTELVVDITARVATITIPLIDWNGTETITFRATDPDLDFSEDGATFDVTAINDDPVLTDIPDQAIAEGASFATINLDDYVSDADNTDAEMTWTYVGNTELTVDITARVATISVPDAEWNGAETITFRATDPGALFAEDAATFTISADNDAPVVSDIPDQTVDEGAAFATINLNNYVTDLDNIIDDITWSYSGNTELGVNITTGIATIVIPGSDWNGFETITFRATDPGLLFSEDAVLFTVTAVDDPPVLDPVGAQIVYENTNLSLTITSSDPDGTFPTLSATGLPTNADLTDLLNGTATFVFDPDYDQEGIYNVVFKAFDGVDVDSEVVEITVLNTNRVPVLDPIGPQAATENVTLIFGLMSSDLDGTIPVLSSSALPANATFTDSLNGAGSLEFTPDFAQQGLHQITFYASDGVDTDSELVAITVGDAGNQAPVLDSIGAQFVTEGATLNVTVTGSDPDGTDPNLAAVNMPANATFTDNLDGTGSFQFIPDFTQAGVYGITFIADDGVLADSEMVLVSVTELGNQAPVLDPIISPQVVNENDILTINLSGSDTDFDALRFTFATSNPMSGLSITDNFDGTAVLTYAPDYLSAGTDTIKIFLTDDGTPPLSDVQNLEIQTLDINQPPAIDSIGPYFVKVGRTLDFTVTAQDSTDQSNGTLYLTASGLPTNATFVDNGDGSGDFSFTPDVSQVGVDTVRFIVIDNTSPPMSGALDVEITVVATNQAPELAYIGPKLLNEGDTLIFAVTATDPDGTIPTLTAEGPSGNPLPGGASFIDNLDGTGEFRFETSFIQSGLYGIEIRATDGIDVDKETVLIQIVEAGNQSPNIWFIGSQIVTEAVLLEFALYGDDPDSTIPLLLVDSLPNGASYVDSGGGIGSFSWTPGYTQSGFYNVYFMADDGEIVDTEIVVIEVVDAGNQMPTIDAVDPISGFETDLLFFVVNTHDLDSIMPVLTTSPLPAGASFEDGGDYSGLFQWTTGYYDEGTHVITVYVTDGDDPLLIDSIMVTVIVENTNQIPGWNYWDWPTYSPLEIDEGDSVDFLVMAYDLDTTFPALSIGENITNFNLVDSGNGVGVLTLKPGFDQSGVYYVHFIAHDSDPRYPNDSVTYLGETGFKISINNMDQPPILTPIGNHTVMEGDTLSIWITASDPDGSIPGIFGENMPANSELTGVLSGRTFRFIPDYLQAGEYTVLFSAVSGPLSDSEYVTITVTEAGNQAPVFQPTFADSITFTAGSSVVQHIVTVDPENDAITMTLLSPPLNVVFVDSGNGASSMVFTPDATQYDVTHLFRYVATDSYGAADTAFVYLKPVTYLRGDANNDDAINVADASFLITYIFRSGRAPEVTEAADANFDSDINVSDAVYLINYIFKQGPPPPSPD